MLEVFWRYVGGVLEVFWRYVGGMLEVFWRYFGGMLEVFWRYVGVMLGVCWRYVGGMLELCWRYVGGMLEVCWRYFGGILEGFWRYVGGMLEVCWRYVEGMLEVFWRSKVTGPSDGVPLWVCTVFVRISGIEPKRNYVGRSRLLESRFKTGLRSDNFQTRATIGPTHDLRPTHQIDRAVTYSYPVARMQHLFWALELRTE